MDYIIDGFIKAFQLIFSADQELWGTVFLSIFVSGASILLSCIIIIPIFTYMGLKKSKSERFISRILNSLMSTPSVLVGLLVLLFLARRGPFGFLGLLYTPWAMIIAQFFLISPLIAGLTYELVKSRGREILKLATTLGANRKAATSLVISELKGDLFIYAVNGFSRAISEVGAVMIVGGNIKGQTRVITTSIALQNSMGDYSMAIALGIILIIIAIAINSIIYTYKEKRGDI
jgi:tungstate transport system permease protein